MSGKGGSLAGKLGYQGSTTLVTPGLPPMAITGAANNGAGLVRLTVASTASLTTGQIVLVSGVLGTTEANGTWGITVVDATHVDIPVAFVHAYAGGGTLLLLNAVGLGLPQGVLASSFDFPDVYTCLFSITTAGVLPIPTPSPIWPPPPGGVEPPLPLITQPVANSVGVRPIAIVTWSIEGASFVRELDIGSGALLSACAQGINVQVFDATSTVGGNAFQQYGISVAVTRGTRPTNQIPSLWAQQGALAAGGAFVIIQVPQNVGVNSVEVTAFNTAAPATPAPIVVTHQIATTVNKAYLLDGGDIGFVRMAPGTRQISITNEGTDPIAYYVTWGIDG
jgi:hypothetical protein